MKKNKLKIKRLRMVFLYLCIFLLFAICNIASSITIYDLIDSYNFDYNNETINITGFTNYMIDTNSNSLNDTLVFNLTTNASSEVIYLFYVSMEQGSTIIQNHSNATVSSGSPLAQVTINSRNFEQDKFNYSIDITTQSGELIYSKYNLTTNTYTGYENGPSILSITDQNIDNTQIQLNISINLTENSTSNITAFLDYGENTIASTTETTLTTPNQTVTITIDNETIKSTHHNGTFSINTIMIDESYISNNYTTAVYNYEDFAKTSYIQNINSAAYDNNSNNLSEVLRLNFTANIKSLDTYTLRAAVYDNENNLIADLEHNETLDIGYQNVIIDIPGEDIYRTYYHGTYTVSVAQLAIGNSTQDVLYEAHTTDTYVYYEFEPPARPDLNISIDVAFNGSANLMNITVQNIGEAPAFNVFANIFDNESFDEEESVAFLNISDSITFNFTADNTTNESIFIALVDLNNVVDESDETNNIATNAVFTQYALILKNDSDLTTAYIDYEGNVWLNGNLYTNATFLRTGRDELVVRYANEDVLTIDRVSGNMYLKGTVYENQTNLSTNATADEFVIKDDNNETILYVDRDGNLRTKGTITATTTISTYHDVNVKNSGTTSAQIDAFGNLLLSGSFTEQTNQSRSANDEWIINRVGEDILILDAVFGNAYIDGELFENQETLTPEVNSFIIQDVLGETVLYLNSSGSLFMKGTVHETYDLS
jgi:hypothetical protein